MVDTYKLVFKYKGKTPDENFSKFDNALVLKGKIRNGEISLNDAIDEQTKFKSDMREIKRVQKMHFSKENKESRTNIENLYNARKAAINFYMNILHEYDSRYQAKKMQEQDLKY